MLQTLQSAYQGENYNHSSETRTQQSGEKTSPDDESAVNAPNKTWLARRTSLKAKHTTCNTQEPRKDKTVIKFIHNLYMNISHLLLF